MSGTPVGLGEDPFFFDVEQFFKVRAGAVDEFAKQNVNSIVIRMPVAYLQTAAMEQVFDIWLSTSTQ